MPPDARPFGSAAAACPQRARGAGGAGAAWLLAALLLACSLAPTGAAQDGSALDVFLSPPWQSAPANVSVEYNVSWFAPPPEGGDRAVRVEAFELNGTGRLRLDVAPNETTLAAGAQEGVRVTATAETGTSSGTYAFLVRVLDAQTGERLGEDRAELSVTSSAMPESRFDAAPDLHVELLDENATVRAGGPFTHAEHRLRIENRGGSAQVVLRAREADGRLPPAPADENGTWLPPRTTMTLIHMYPLGSNVEPGTYRVLLDVGVLGHEGMNRTFEARLVVEPRFGASGGVDTLGANFTVRMHGPADIIVVAPGDVAEVPLTVENTGASAAWVRLGPATAYRSDAGDEVAGGYGLALDLQAFPLEPGEVRAVTLRVEAPRSAPQGEAVGVLVPYDVTGENDPANGIGMVRVRVEGEPVEDAATASQEDAAEADGDAPHREPGVGGWGVAAAVGAAVVVAASGAAFVLRQERRRYEWLGPIAALYTRIARSDLLAHDTREQILDRVTREPGVRYSELQRALQLNTGTLVHHLRALERGQLVTSRRDGPHRRFYAAGAAPRSVPVSAPAPPPFTPMQRRVLDLLRGGPRTQREIAEALGLTQQGANHHVKALERRGAVLLREETPGRWRVHRVVTMETVEHP